MRDYVRSMKSEETDKTGDDVITARAVTIMIHETEGSSDRGTGISR